MTCVCVCVCVPVARGWCYLGNPPTQPAWWRGCRHGVECVAGVGVEPHNSRGVHVCGVCASYDKGEIRQCNVNVRKGVPVSFAPLPITRSFSQASCPAFTSDPITTDRRLQVHPQRPHLVAAFPMLSAVGLVYGLAAFTPTRVLNGRSGTPTAHAAHWVVSALAGGWRPERPPAALATELPWPASVSKPPSPT